MPRLASFFEPLRTVATSLPAQTSTAAMPSGTFSLPLILTTTLPPEIFALAGALPAGGSAKATGGPRRSAYTVELVPVPEWKTAMPWWLARKSLRTCPASDGIG
jgi:hypothetical protein